VRARVHDPGVERLAERLKAIPGVVAVALGGSRAAGTATGASDWDFGLYYRGEIDVQAVRDLGYAGTVVEPGEWGRLVNGGAWLEVDGVRVDLLYRDLDVVERWTKAAEKGRFEIDFVEGFVAGMATYVLAGELALAKVLVGELPRPDFPDRLRETAPARWYASARFSLEVADSAARRSDVGACVGLAAKAALAAAQGRLAERGEWALNEKGIVRRAGLGRAETILAAVGSRPTDLAQAIERLRVAFALPS
jgi:predicted nucleotidyltransferase